MEPAPTTADAAAATGPLMDRAFVERNQIVERYLSGKLPARGAADFERFCRAHPELLDEIGLPERVNAGVRLLEAGGQPEPWAEKQVRPWERPQVTFGLAGALVLALIALAVVASNGAARKDRIAALERAVAEQPLLPATSTRTVRVEPARSGPTSRPALTIGGGPAQLADLKLDLSWSKFSAFRVTIDRQEQGRVAVLHNMTRDSNGEVRLALNSTALGPGRYDLTIEGLTRRMETVPQAWVTIAIQR